MALWPPDVSLIQTVMDGLGSAWAEDSVLPPGTAVGVATDKMSGSGEGVGVNAAWAVAVARRGGLARPQAVSRVKSKK
jgi:hypothetical protein